MEIKQAKIVLRGDVSTVMNEREWQFSLKSAPHHPSESISPKPI